MLPRDGQLEIVEREWTPERLVADDPVVDAEDVDMRRRFCVALALAINVPGNVVIGGGGGICGRRRGSCWRSWRTPDDIRSAFAPGCFAKSPGKGQKFKFEAGDNAPLGKIPERGTEKRLNRRDYPRAVASRIRRTRVR